MAVGTFQNIPFTNIDTEDFVAEDGAKWGGEEVAVKAGDTVQVPPFLAKHLAKHLTNKMLIRQANAWLKENAKESPQFLAKEQSWMDVKLREPLTSKMLGWTVEKLRAELERDEKGLKKEEPKAETVLKSDVERLVAEAVKKAVGQVASDVAGGEFPELENIKKSRPVKVAVTA